jgi:aspartate/glutamate racemase
MLDAHKVEELRQDVLARGWRRVIVLGTPEHMAGPSLRRPLAASGVMVLAPGKEDRATIGRMLDEGVVDEAMLNALLCDGLEHGVDAVVVSDERLARVVEGFGLLVPVVRVCC